MRRAAEDVAREVCDGGSSRQEGSLWACFWDDVRGPCKSVAKRGQTAGVGWIRKMYRAEMGAGAARRYRALQNKSTHTSIWKCTFPQIPHAKIAVTKGFACLARIFSKPIRPGQEVLHEGKSGSTNDCVMHVMSECDTARPRP
jgi:hypothetical protein